MALCGAAMMVLAAIVNTALRDAAHDPGATRARPAVAAETVIERKRDRIVIPLDGMAIGENR